MPPSKPSPAPVFLLLLLLLVSCVCVCVCRPSPHAPPTPNTTPPSAPAPPAPPGHIFSQAHFRFTLDLYLALTRQVVEGGGNLVFSPVGVASVLSPLIRAPSQDVSSQVRQVLWYSNMSVSEIEAAHDAMMLHFSDSYYQDSLRLSSSLYLQHTSTSPLCDVFPGEAITEVDMRENITGVARDIQQWVNVVSGGKLQAPPLNAPLAAPLALLLLYFSGRWLHGFDPARTFDHGLFFITDQHRFEIPMMVGRLEVPLGYSAELEVRVLELPLSARRASLFILLPDHGLASFERNITADNIKTLLSTLKDERVNIRVPRFKIEGAPPLRQALVSLGLTSLFPSDTQQQQRDDSRQQQHLLHNFIHSAACEVVEGEAPPTPTPAGDPVVSGTFGDKYFEVDHPFVFFVWDYLASSILVMGRVVSPQPITRP